MKKFTLLLLTLSLSIAFVAAQDVVLPIDFEGGPYEITDFDGGELTVIANSESSGINTSANVAQMVKGAGQTWGGSYITLTSPIDFTNGYVLSMKVFSPRADVPVLLKLENADDAGVFSEVTSNTTVSNEWETLTFDFDGAATDTYSKVVLIFENGTAGDGSADWTFLVDDIQHAADDPGPSAISLNESNDIKIFSNNGTIFINSDEDLINGQVEVFQITGQKIISSNISSSNEQINIDSKGMFIVRITDSFNMPLVTKKLLVY